MQDKERMLLKVIESVLELQKSFFRLLKLKDTEIEESATVDVTNNLERFEFITEELMPYLKRPSVKYMAKIVEDWYNNSPQREKEEFITTEFDSLVVFMNPIGINIINQFNLWAYPWTKQINEDGVDESPDHPESVALQVIETVWRNVKND